MAQADVQRAYRQRKAEKADRMRLSLERIDAKLDGNTKPLAIELRAIVKEGLA